MEGRHSGRDATERKTVILNSNTERAAQVMLVLLLCLAIAQSSRAADTVTASVLACAKLAASERLSCYDQLAARLREQQSRDPASAGPATAAGSTPPRQPPAAAPRAATAAYPSTAPEPRIDAQFGLPRPVEHAASSSITARVTAVHLTPQHRAIIELDNGQRWQELGNADLDLAIGDTVNISRAALGSFWLSAPSNRGAKVSRLR